MSLVKEHENSEILFPTLEQYKNAYSTLLSNFLREYEDNHEKIFIELQIEYWKNYGDEFLKKQNHTFNKYQIERLKASRNRIVVFLEEKLNLTEEKSKIENTNNIKTKQYWFKIGVKLATGEIQEKLKNGSARSVAISLGNKNYRPYITDSIGVNKKSDKNIFSRKKEDIKLILNYCLENNLKVCQEFEDKIKNIIAD